MLKKVNQQLIAVTKYLLLVAVLIITTACSSDDNTTIDTLGEDAPDEENLPEEIKILLPVFSVNTNGVEIVNDPKIDASYTITEDGETLFSGNMGIEIRGASSQTFPKKSYGFETWDAEGNDIDVALFEMPEEEDWILNGPYSDKTLIRNVLIYDLAREMNHYASRTEFVTMNINGENNGLYVFMEKLKRDKERIDINKLKDDENEGEDLTGGYIIKIDKSENEGHTSQNSFNSRYASTTNLSNDPTRFLYEYPDADDITEQQKEYISSYITDFEEALVSAAFTDPDTGYASYIDVDSFVDFFILNELSNNVDGYRISTYMHKDKNEKLRMGPIWDFNLAFGNADYCSGGETNVWAYKFNERCPGDVFHVPFWWSRLLEDPTFVARLKERWSELRAGTLSDGSILSKVDGYLETIDAAANINFTRWPILGTYVWPNNFIGNTYNEETDYLKQWISNRTIWLDDSISTL